uniref:Uncharacterized protein n=1 Tax=Triticum urartu TaxID=4572 RepID=A0A8R7QZ16_TRIUA
FSEHVVDGFLPRDWHGYSFYVGSEVIGVDRNKWKKRRVTIKLRRPGYEGVVVQSPLPKDWQGYSVKFAESLKVLYTVEFQKRGLPHAHILVWRKGGNGEIGVESINSFISAEIPDPLLDPLGYALVSEFMMHGPCGDMNDKCICMKNGACSKYFPKDFRDTTIVDDNGFVL